MRGLHKIYVFGPVLDELFGFDFASIFIDFWYDFGGKTIKNEVREAMEKNIDF